MSGVGSSLANGGVEALLEAAKFVEEQEKQKLRREIEIPKPSELSCRKDIHEYNTRGRSRIELPQHRLSKTELSCREDIHEYNTRERSRIDLPQHRLSKTEEYNEVKEASLHNGVHSQSSTRIPTHPTMPRHGSVIREFHNKLEKNRRAHLKECFEFLKRQLPLSPDEKKTSNLSILHNAIRYLALLKRKERELEHEMERLAREKISYQQKLATLKKELTAQWEHIDLNKLLPEVVEPEPRRTSDVLNGRMMETGSDEELVRTSTMYSSTSSLSSASPLHSAPDLQSHHTQVVSSPGPPTGLLVSPIQQLLPSTTIRMLPADTHFVHSHIPTTGITIQNGVINHSAVALASKHPVSTESNTLVTPGLLNHSLVMSQPSGPFLLAAPPHINDKVMTAPVLKSISQVPIQSQFLVKPTMVVVSAATNTPK